MAKRKRRKKATGEPHVRLYKHELESDAYRSLSCEARALLIEMRSFYNGEENRVFMSIRTIMKRINVSQTRAQRAIAELKDRGFVVLLEKGSFDKRNRLASEYRLTNFPVRGSLPPTREFMTWRRTKKNDGGH